MKAPSHIPDLVSRWPTIGSFSVAIGCGYEAARKMRERGKIAPEWWEAVISAAAEQGVGGVDLSWLTRQHTSPTTLIEAERATPSRSEEAA